MGAFGTVLIVVCVLAVIVAALSFRGSGNIYRGLGRTGLLAMDEDDSSAAGRSGPPTATSAEAQEEIRQMLEAKSARRVTRGQAPLDIDAELQSLTAAPQVSHDAGLREEVRQLVEARNERRMRQGKPPLDVDEEVERQLRELGT